MVWLPHTVAGYVWKGVVISATVYGFMILCPRWYRENIGIIDFSEGIMSQCIVSSKQNGSKLSWKIIYIFANLRLYGQQSYEKTLVKNNQH